MNKIIKRSLMYLLKVSPLVWVLLGFSLSYLLFFIRPIFFSSPEMLFTRYVPAVNPIGVDLNNTLRTAESFFVAKQNPYIGNNQYAYPPLTSVLVLPLLLVNLSTAYAIVTLTSVLCFVMITFVLPLRPGEAGHVSPILMLIFITGLFSYGFQFELERGQFNLIAVAMCFLAIWIFHYHNRYRLIAYILFTISVQLKVYPLIFIVMLISNWQDWRNNVKRVLVLVAVNLALLLVLGPYLLVDFVKAIISQSVDPAVWTGNHSIRSYMTILTKIASDHGWTWVNQFSGLAQIAILLIVILLIFLILLQAYRQKQNGFNPNLLLACAIGALLIPSASHDYTLSFLAAPVAFFLSNKKMWETANSSRQRFFLIEMLFIFSVAYSSTLFSYTYKPLTVNNNFPALFIMLVVVALLSLVSMKKPQEAGPESLDIS